MRTRWIFFALLLGLGTLAAPVSSAAQSDGDLSLAVTGPGPLTVGFQADITVHVVNHAGPTLGPFRMVVGSVPPDLEIVSVGGTGWTCIANDPQSRLCQWTGAVDGDWPGTLLIRIVPTIPQSAQRSLRVHVDDLAGARDRTPDDNGVDVVIPPVAAAPDPPAPPLPTPVVVAPTFGFAPVTAARLFDTRPTEAQGAITVTKRMHGPDDVLKINLTGIAGLPTAGLAAVSLNVAVVDPLGNGFVTVYPCGTRPLTANVNYMAGQTVSNAVIAQVSATGELCLFSHSPTHLVADVTGWFGPPQ